MILPIYLYGQSVLRKPTEEVSEGTDVKQLIAELYHAFSHSDFNFFCACKTISDGRKAGLTPEESTLFGKDSIDKVVRIRTLLDHILELIDRRDDAIGWEGMLDGEFVMHLLFWCGWNGSKNEALLNYVTKRCEGKVNVVKMGAVMRVKRLLAYKDNHVVAQEQQTFNCEIDAFIDSLLYPNAENHN